MPAADHGSDFYCIIDLDPGMTVVEGRNGLAQAAARRLGTPRRHLFYDVEYGSDLSELIGSSVNELVIQQRAETEVIKDERVGDARSEVTLKEAGDEGVQEDQIGDMEITVQLYDDDGPFPLTLDVSGGEVTIAILEENL